MDWLGPLSQRVAHFKSIGHCQWPARAHKPEPIRQALASAGSCHGDGTGSSLSPGQHTGLGPPYMRWTNLANARSRAPWPSRAVWAGHGARALQTTQQWLRVSGSVFVYKMQGRPWKPWGDRLSYIDSNPSVVITTQYAATEVIRTYWARVVIQHNTQ